MSKIVGISFIKGCPERHKKLFMGRFAHSDIEFKEAKDASYLIATPFLYRSKESQADFQNQAPSKVTVIDMFAEAISPDFNWFDYAIGTDALEAGDRMIRFPLRMECYKDIDMIREKSLKDFPAGKKVQFCNFIYSNACAHPNRDAFFHELSRYKRVNSLGRHLNNTDGDNLQCGDANGDKWFMSSVSLKQPYKFSISFENACFRGYLSEKLPTSLMAGTVPIYWGNPDIEEEYNPKSFINCHRFGNFDEVVDFIKYLDEDDAAYAGYLDQPCRTPQQQQAFINRLINEQQRMDEIFLQEPLLARRKGEGFWQNIYREATLQRMNVSDDEGVRRGMMGKLLERLSEVFGKKPSSMQR